MDEDLKNIDYKIEELKIQVNELKEYSKNMVRSFEELKEIIKPYKYTLEEMKEDIRNIKRILESK